MDFTPNEWRVISLSLQISAGALLLAFPWALAFGWLLARHDFPGKSLVETCLSLPLVLPPIVVGYLLLVAFGGHSWLGQWMQALHLRLPFTTAAAILAAAVISFPLLLRAIQLSIAEIDPGLEAAASTLGAAPWQVFRWITLPLAWRGIIGGALLAFTRSLGEFGATVIFAGNTPGISQTIPLAIYSLDQAGTPQAEGAAQRLVLIAIGIALLATGLSNRLLRPKRPSPPLPPLPPSAMESTSVTTVTADLPKALPADARLSIDLRWEVELFSLQLQCTLANEITGLHGPSGNGKTSLLQLMAGLHQPSFGRICWQQDRKEVLCDTHNNIHTPPYMRHFGIVFQEDRLFPHMNVADNIRFGLRVSTTKSTLAPEHVESWLGLSKLCHRMPEALSGGERQRVALARALMCNPRMLLLDEPFNSLDPAQKQEMVTLLKELHTRLQLPILLVSHDRQMLEALSTRILSIHNGRLIDGE